MLWLMCAVLAGEPVVIPGSEAAVVFEEDAADEVRSALADLEAGRFEEAARQLRALADAGGGAELRYLLGLALYEQGQVRAAEVAVASALQSRPDLGVAANLYGLILADLGRGDEALGFLDRALSSESATSELKVHALVNKGVVHEDMGQISDTERAWTKALKVAKSSGMSSQVAEIGSRLASLRRGGDADVVGAVSAKLRAGDRAAARALAAASEGGTLRQQLRGVIAGAAVARADGRLDVAAARLVDALSRAERAGLLREAEASRLELARVWMLSGRLADSAKALDEGWRRLQNTSLKVRATDVRLLRGRVAARMEDLGRARQELEAVRGMVATLQHPALVPQVDELMGAVEELAGNAGAADAALQRGARAHASSKSWMDAARLHTERVRVLTASGADPSGAEGEARAAFDKAGDSLGPAHVHMARALGHASAKRIDDALEGFAAAAAAARAVGGTRADGVAAVADANAAEALKVLGHDAAAVDGADVADVVDRHATFTEARAAYDRGRVAFDKRDFSAAVEAFGVAQTSFDALGEADSARRSALALGWSEWNLAAAAAPDNALGHFERALVLAESAGDAELALRSRAGAAIAGGRLGRLAVAPVLRSSARDAGAAGLKSLEARCHATMAEMDLPLAQRALAARAALGVGEGDIGLYAIEAVAVSAIQQGESALALSLLREVLDVSWKGQENIATLHEAAIRQAEQQP